MQYQTSPSNSDSKRRIHQSSVASAYLRTIRCPRAARSHSGSVSPLIIFSLTIIVAFIALSVDVSRTAHAAQVIQFAAESAGLHAYRMSFTDDGQRRQGNLEELVLSALQEPAGASEVAWNFAPAGPKNGTTQTAVMFDSSDVAVVSNAGSGDQSDFVLRVRARREGADALRMFFLPAIYAFSSWSGLTTPASANEATPYRISEIITQPATRIGAGPERGSIASSGGRSFAGSAIFPLAISNKQFLAIAANSRPGANITIDVANSTQAPTSSSTASRIKGAFVNVFGTGGLQYYGNSTGSLAISQLKGTLEYFSSTPAGAVNSPAMVERGSMLSAFDAGEQSFQTETINILSAANRGISPVRYHALPVLADDPRFTQRNQVIGFARLALLQATRNATTGDITVSAILGESSPMLNASVGTGFSEIPVVDGAALPAPSAPFQPRAFDPAANTIARRMTAIVMAPALSPRKVPGASL